MSGEALVGVADIRAARVRIDGDLRVTPVWQPASLSTLAGRQVWLKAENLQRTGSFKPRGALSFLRADPGDRRPLVAASAGNHAQGVALAAAMAGRSVTVFMPTTGSLPKVRATREYGAEVRQVGDSVDDAIAAAKVFAEESGAVFVSPFDHPLVIAGQGTVGLELAEQVPPGATVLVPVGGGGLVSGVAAALRGVGGDWTIIGVEAAGAASMVASLAAGRPTAVASPATMADGIALKSPSELTLAHVEALVDDVVMVSEEEIAAAVLLLMERARCVVEPAGAVGLAALLGDRVVGGGPVVCLLSGGNVDPLLLTALIEHGLNVAGRYLRLRAVVPDRPGALAHLTALLAELRLNVTDVEHHRAGSVVGVAEVEVLVTVETRDRQHGDEVLAALRAAGVRVEVDAAARP
ncbi:MAG: threonine ammonia-lyase [Acidimicrobiales bacterium]|nr:threonine ammonia-lyase [Acidimicrobiales bacterium]